MIRLATPEDIPHITRIASSLKKQLGYVMRVALIEAQKKDWLLYHPDGAFCNFRLRRDGVTVIYEIATFGKARSKGIGRQMIEKLPRPIQLKCPIDNKSNGFYDHLGFELIEVSEGKKRKLNVWRIE
jgi:N-acetylglutamate synthase-like GNAT family acetyltransferase